jgi:hypothetical protein
MQAQNKCKLTCPSVEQTAPAYQKARPASRMKPVHSRNGLVSRTALEMVSPQTQCKNDTFEASPRIYGQSLAS